ncbi:hypothetical protein cyc_05141 [Cyclospora cayetanensis]|uniref:Uncharacterized protein n=1 Tax=Cyclospora cayetanensis TaxID=88456 RepID=A0A1D3D0U1_9EIME|nr:hypothetical protein cyc_05141 [Cyclospora cayetanensis]
MSRSPSPESSSADPISPVAVAHTAQRGLDLCSRGRDSSSSVSSASPGGPAQAHGPRSSSCGSNSSGNSNSNPALSAASTLDDLTPEQQTAVDCLLLTNLPFEVCIPSVRSWVETTANTKVRAIEAAPFLPPGAPHHGSNATLPGVPAGPLHYQSTRCSGGGAPHFFGGPSGRAREHYGKVFVQLEGSSLVRGAIGALEGAPPLQGRRVSVFLAYRVGGRFCPLQTKAQIRFFGKQQMWKHRDREQEREKKFKPLDGGCVWLA